MSDSRLGGEAAGPDTISDRPGGQEPPADPKARSAASAEAAGQEAGHTGSLLRDRSFRLLFTAAAASMFGTHVSLLAIPLVAVTTLDATAGQVGVLGMLSTMAFLLVGLPVGAWMDRLRRRPMMIAADLVRAVLIGSVPVAWWLDSLIFLQLCAVVFVSGICTVFFDVSSQSYLPAIVPRDRLVDANSRISGMDAFNSVAGPGVAGLLIQLITAPVAAAIDAVTYLWSALCLSGIRRREPAPQAAGKERHLVQEIKEGVAVVFRHPLLRAIAVNAVLTNLSIIIVITIMPLLFIRELQLSAATLGLFFAIDGLGMLLGALTARRVTAWLGEGRGLWIIGCVAMPACIVYAFVDRGPLLWVAAVAWLIANYRIGVNNVVLISFRQQITAPHLLGRVNATMRFLMTGVLSLGAALSGAIGQWAGARAALWTGAIGLALVWVTLYFSPFRNMRELPKDQTAGG